MVVNEYLLGDETMLRNSGETPRRQGILQNDGVEVNTTNKRKDFNGDNPVNKILMISLIPTTDFISEKRKKNGII